jgi:hypothetical protein
MPQYLNGSSVAGNITGGWISMATVNQGSFSVGWTGNGTGVLYVEGANGGQYNVPLSNSAPTRYHILLQLTITAGVQPDANSPTSWLAEVLPTSVKAVRLHYVATSGTGNMYADFYSKSTG